MSRKEDLNKLINNHKRRLQKLKEKKAILGLSADPSIEIGIEEIESEIKKLEQVSVEHKENNANPNAFKQL